MQLFLLSFNRRQWFIIVAVRNESIAQKYKINSSHCFTNLPYGIGKLHDEHARAFLLRQRSQIKFGMTFSNI